MHMCTVDGRPGHAAAPGTHSQQVLQQQLHPPVHGGSPVAGSVVLTQSVTLASGGSGRPVGWNAAWAGSRSGSSLSGMGTASCRCGTCFTMACAQPLQGRNSVMHSSSNTRLLLTARGMSGL